MVATPDLSVKVADISQHRIIPPMRGQSFPQDHWHETYAFDPISERDLSHLRSQAQALARLMGFEVESGGPAAECFSGEVPDEVMGDSERAVVRGSVALVEVEGFGWLAAEKVDEEAFDEWRRDKLCGPRPDDRLAGNTTDDRGRR